MGQYRLMKFNFQIEETYFKSYLKNAHSQDTSILYSFFLDPATIQILLRRKRRILTVSSQVCHYGATDIKNTKIEQIQKLWEALQRI